MGIKDKLISLITDEEEEVLELTEEEAKALSDYEKPNKKGVVKMAGDTKMVLFEPRSFDEAEEIATHLKNRKAAVVNLHRLNRDYAQRCIDFLTGVVFALDGTIQKIGQNVILCTPHSIGVEGAISLDSLNDDY